MILFFSVIVQDDSHNQDDCSLTPIVSTSPSSHIILPNLNCIAVCYQHCSLPPPLALPPSLSPMLTFFLSLPCHVQWATWCNVA